MIAAEKLRVLLRAAKAGYFLAVSETWRPGTISRLNAAAGDLLGEKVDVFSWDADDRVRFVRTARGMG